MTAHTSQYSLLRILRIYLSLFILSSSAIAFAQTAQTKNILIVGDSLSAAYGLSREQGWVYLLSQRVKQTAPTYSVINASISGETTAGGWQRLPSLLKTHMPAIVIIELGGNDALRGLDLNTSRSTLDKMIQASLQTRAKVVLIPMKMPPNYGSAYAKQFESMYVELAKKHQIGLSNFFLEQFADNSSMFQNDRIHPTSAAQPLMLDSVWPTLKPLLK